MSIHGIQFSIDKSGTMASFFIPIAKKRVSLQWGEKAFFMNQL